MTAKFKLFSSEQNSDPFSKKYVAIGQAAQQLHVAIDTLRRWEKEGKIKAIRSAGGIRLFAIDELNRLLERTKTNEKTYTISQAATFLGVSPATLRRWDRENRLKPLRSLGNERLYSKSELERFIKTISERSWYRGPTVSELPQQATKSPVAYIKEKAYEFSDAIVLTLIDRSIFIRYRSKILVVLIGLLFIASVASQHNRQHKENNLLTPIASEDFSTAAQSLAKQADKQGFELVLVEKSNASAVEDRLSKAEAPYKIALSSKSKEIIPVSYRDASIVPQSSLTSDITGFSAPSWSQANGSGALGNDQAIALTATGQTSSQSQLSGATLTTALLSGTSTLAASRTSAFVPVPRLTRASKVFISFQTQISYMPYTIEKHDHEGFVLTLQKPAEQPIIFDWLIVN